MVFDYSIILTEHDGRLQAALPDFPGCYGEGTDRASATDDTRVEGVRCIFQELEEGNPLPLRSPPKDLCRDNAGETVMLTLAPLREENRSWLG